MKFLLISPKNRTVWNFRGDLIRDLQARGWEVTVTGPDRTDEDRIRALGVRFIEIPMNKTGTSALQDLHYLRALCRTLRAERPDATLAYTSKPVIYGSVAAKLLGVRNCSAMITGGGYTFTAKTLKARLLGFVVRHLYRVSLRCCSQVIFQNPDDRDEFIRLGLVPANKCEVVRGSGVNMEKFCPGEPREANRPLTFLMVSRLLKSKGVTEYLEAAKLLKQKYPELDFRLLGKYETDMQDAVPTALVKEYEDAGVITRYGETRDMVDFYRNCDVYVLPSYREGTPRTVLEAMACGRPIVTTDANGCRETVEDGVNGYLVPPRDSAALAEALERYVHHPELLKPQGEASLNLCRDRFEVHKVNEDMLRFMCVNGDGSD